MKNYLFLLLLVLSGCSLAKDNIGTTYYQRDYSPEHLEAHPQQRVKNILVSLKYFNTQEIKEIDRDGVIAGVDVLVKYIFSNNWYNTTAICRQKTKNSLQCNVDGDEGNFVLEKTNDGIELKVINLVLFQCGISETDIRDGKIEDGYDGIGAGDDDSYLILRSTSAKAFKTVYDQNKCQWIP